jgi:hypothetical protein
MLDELIAEQQYRLVREDRTRLAMEAEARSIYGDVGMRERIASALVAVGGWLDRSAIERAAGTRGVVARTGRGL